MMRGIFGLLVCCLLACVEAEKAGKALEHTNIVLIGATGDLAKKYLWRSLFELFSENFVKGERVYSIYGCSRQSADTGREFVSDVLLRVITCSAEDENCRSRKRRFTEAVQYHQLKTEENYAGLAAKINENTQSMYGLQGTGVTPEVGRLVYLSIPPSAYVKTSLLVDQYLRPEVGRPWFRVVLEKPFGHDHESAKALTEKLGKVFTDQELYRIDHYLGKTVVKEILPFRYLNKEQYQDVWNRQHIERVEVVMKEKIDVKGRTSFYDDVGIVRDVMQNHLMEMAALVAMELPEDSGKVRDLLASKIRVLSEVETLGDQALVTGQYASYYNQCLEELPHVKEPLNTPTFGAAVLSINNARWRGVPFLLVSGKKLDEKYSYIRIVFKDSTYSTTVTKSPAKPIKQIIFHISTGDLSTPAMISVSKGLPSPRMRNGWTLLEDGGDRSMFGEDSTNANLMVSDDVTSAYTTLLDGVLKGYRHMFVDSKSLLLSWKVWNQVVKNTERRRPRIYRGKEDSHLLDVQILSPKSLQYVTQDKLILVDDFLQSDFRELPATFQGHKLVSGETETVVKELADLLRETALTAVKNRGVFHLALPGGQSPMLLFQHLAASPNSLPWQDIHVWLVDERCVALNHAQSNFQLIYSQLLQHVPIPYLNIHPMPVDLDLEPCGEGDNGDQLYSSTLKKAVVNGTLDFVLLGVGYDGHVASLFPNKTSLVEQDAAVLYSEAGPDKVSPRRMTLTYRTLNSAHQIAIICLGRKKHQLLSNLQQHSSEDANLYPVLGIRPSNSQLVWFVDYDALLGVQ